MQGIHVKCGNLQQHGSADTLRLNMQPERRSPLLKDGTGLFHAATLVGYHQVNIVSASLLDGSSYLLGNVGSILRTAALC